MREEYPLCFKRWDCRVEGIVGTVPNLLSNIPPATFGLVSILLIVVNPPAANELTLTILDGILKGDDSEHMVHEIADLIGDSLADVPMGQHL